jgi:membrane fusion protein (multidrug efflux system)
MPAQLIKPVPRKHVGRRIILLGVLVAVIALIGSLLRSWVIRAWNTQSTDDAYVNGHVTFVAPRVAGQVKAVFVDDNMRVKAGQLLVELDPEPFQVQVEIKKSLVSIAQANLIVADAQVRGTLAQARSLRWKLQASMEAVDNQVALLSAKVAALRSKEATWDRAKADLVRARETFTKGATARQDLDAAIEAEKVAQAQVNQAREEVYETRVFLGQPPIPADGNLTSVPKNLRQTFSSVRQALAELVQVATQVGLPLAKSEETPEEVLDRVRSKDFHKDIDKVFEKLIPEAPAIKQAEANLLKAKSDLKDAELNLSYCKIYADIDGVVTRRNANPGNFVQVSQQLMAVRSLREIWIDANFKETQLAEMRIGQRVDIFSDIYGSQKVYKGHITGFTYGTGSTLALLPAQNATGNFVKVVQRLPVRIELQDYDPDTDTLFAGLSVTPYVYVKEPPEGPNAGRRLQEVMKP